ncbi:putative toxin biosynthesis protein [Aureobasidium pullulans]|nr:putative toxin biosynthesis protein [Aureobasidium pullulans]
MSSSFKVVEHHTPCQSIREYPQATSTYQEEVLHLSAKQYIPLNRTPQEGDVTILAAHASAFPKELYEPLWEDLLKQSKKAGYGIRSIWMADVANQGASYVLNEGKTGNDPNYADHARDLLCLINTHRSEFTRPIIGVGHSMGTISLSLLAQMHPRLLTSIVMLDAIIVHKPLPAWVPMTRMPSFRRDLWPSRQTAEAAFRKNVLLKPFDPRVVDKILQHMLWLYGTKSYTMDPIERSEKMKRTGTEWNGSGGAAMGRVKEEFIEDTGHFLCFEKIKETAEKVSEWLDSEVKIWKDLERVTIDKKWHEKDVVGRQCMDENWLKGVKAWKGDAAMPLMGEVKSDPKASRAIAKSIGKRLRTQILPPSSLPKPSFLTHQVTSTKPSTNTIHTTVPTNKKAIATMSLITREDLPLAIIYFFLSFYHQPLAYLFLGLRILYSIFSGPDDSSKKQPTATTTSSSSSFFPIDLEFVALGLIYHYLTNLGFINDPKTPTQRPLRPNPPAEENPRDLTEEAKHAIQDQLQLWMHQTTPTHTTNFQSRARNMLIAYLYLLAWTFFFTTLFTFWFKRCKDREIKRAAAKKEKEEGWRKHVYKVYVKSTDQEKWYWENLLVEDDRAGYWDDEAINMADANGQIENTDAIILSIIFCLIICLVWCTSCCQPREKPMTEEELKKHVYRVYWDPTDKRMWYYENRLAVPDKPGYWDRDGDYHRRH